MARRRSRTPAGLTFLREGAPRAALRRLRGDARASDPVAPALVHDRDAPELVLSPHPDDAVLDCWSLLASGRTLNVVNVFAGIPAAGESGTWEVVLGVADSAERARMRLAEDARALALAGRDAVNLPLLDAEHRRREGGRTAAVGPAEVDAHVARAVPAAARVHVPAGIGGHPDHVLLRRYGELLAAVGMPVSAYAELPYASAHGWPEWVDGVRDPSRGDVEAYWRSFLRGVTGLGELRDGAVERLGADAVAARAAAVACYAASLNHGMRRSLADADVGGFEVRWELAG